MRAGTGYDVHRFAEGRKLILCGVESPYEKGLLGHSDADVALHAVMDALLGAAALRDIGYHFPDHDPAYEGISSIKLLERVREMLLERFYAVENIDVTIIAQAPKLRPYIDQMIYNIADALRIDADQVNVKATTEEGLGFTGSMQGMAAQAVCVISSMLDELNSEPPGCMGTSGGCPGCSGCGAFGGDPGNSQNAMPDGRAGCPGCGFRTDTD